MKYKVKIAIAFICAFALVSKMSLQAQEVSDYLVTGDIGDYKFITHMKDFITGEIKPKPGYRTRISPGVLAGADHFDLDHNDTTYETDYINKTVRLAVDVQVTQHAGGDSDKWLLHELEKGFRKGKDLHATLISPNPLRQINGNTILYTWGYYRWLSNYVLVSIGFTDLTGTKPEPLEVVQAYLQKFPSTIPSTLILDKAHSEQWIKDEMERRLWLCDKWLQQLDEGKIEQYKALSAMVNDHLKVFLDYREKYYGISAGAEKQALYGYLQAKNEKEIRNKLTEYKQWWAENKTKPINLP